MGCLFSRLPLFGVAVKKQAWVTQNVKFASYETHSFYTHFVSPPRPERRRMVFTPSCCIPHRGAAGIAESALRTHLRGMRCLFLSAYSQLRRFKLCQGMVGKARDSSKLLEDHNAPQEGSSLDVKTEPYEAGQLVELPPSPLAKQGHHCHQ